ncbi:MAG: four helix bundle protein [Patescibacteria group bacterium]|nr:four helix bundle protein [Patescibacteria group bacterium]
MKIEKFEDIIAWQLGRELVQFVYSNLRDCRDYAFKDQMQRATISITNNIAEGFGRKGDKELTRYLKISKGSCLEVRSMLYSALDLGYFDQKQFNHSFALTVRIEQTIIKFIQSISIYETKDAGRRT